jgi:hypothetical protein
VPAPTASRAHAHRESPPPDEQPRQVQQAGDREGPDRGRERTGRQLLPAGEVQAGERGGDDATGDERHHLLLCGDPARNREPALVAGL